MKYDAKRYYAFLGVDPMCSDEELRAAFRRRAKQLHPDSESGDEAEFIRLKKVYDLLSKPSKRAHYDRISRPRSASRAPPLEWSAPIPRPRRFRFAGMSFARLAAAFVFMSGLSVAALEVILADSDVSPGEMFNFAGDRADPAHVVTEKRFTVVDPAAAPSIETGETADEFAERIQHARAAAHIDGSALGGNPTP